jgi:hypothetical protein
VGMVAPMMPAKHTSARTVAPGGQGSPRSAAAVEAWCGKDPGDAASEPVTT